MPGKHGGPRERSPGTPPPLPQRALSPPRAAPPPRPPALPSQQKPAGGRDTPRSVWGEDPWPHPQDGVWQGGSRLLCESACTHGSTWSTRLRNTPSCCVEADGVGGGGGITSDSGLQSTALLFHRSPGPGAACRREAPGHPGAEQAEGGVGPLGAKAPVGFEAAQLGHARPRGLGKAPPASGFGLHYTVNAPSAGPGLHGLTPHGGRPPREPPRSRSRAPGRGLSCREPLPPGPSPPPPGGCREGNRGAERASLLPRPRGRACTPPPRSLPPAVPPSGRRTEPAGHRGS